MHELIGYLSDPENLKGALSSDFLRGYSAYEIATLAGFSGTVDEWLDSLRGEKLEIREKDGYLEYKYADQDDTEWQQFMDFSPYMDYGMLNNLPTINGVEFNGEMSQYIMTPDDTLSDDEIEQILIT